MATKKPVPAYLQQKPAFNYAALDEFLATPSQPAAAEAESRGAARGAADLGLSFGRGAVQGVRMFTDLAGADNAVSGGLRTVEDFIGGLRSAQAKQDDQAIAAILKDAEGKGVLDQVMAGFRAFAQAPGSTMAQALGTSVPTIAAALATGGAAPGAALAARAVPATVGALQGTGAVKGSIYDEVYRRALTEGRTEEEARALAEQAQAYSGDNAGQLALGAGLGALAGGSGLERGVQALRGGVTTAAPGIARRVGMGALAEGIPEAPGIARRVGMGALAEGIPEALQGGQEKYATNVAQDRAGFPTDPMAGVVASGTMEAIAGGAMGGAFGIPRPPQRPGDELRKDKLPESGPMTRALNQGVEAAAQAADKGAPIPPELTDAPGATPPPQGMEFEADPRFENTPTFGNGQAPAAQSTGAPAQADEGTAPQAPVAPVLQPEVAPEETSLAPGASEPPGPVQPGDVTMKNGKPFTVKNNGLLRAFERRLGPGYVRTPVEGGIVLRKVGGDGPVAEDAQPGAADDGAVAGDPVLRGGDTEPVAAGEPAPGPVGAAVPGDPAAQLRPGEPEPAAELKPEPAPARTFDPAQPVSYGRFKTRGEVEAYRAMVAPQAATDPDMAEVLTRVDEAIAKADADVQDRQGLRASDRQARNVDGAAQELTSQIQGDFAEGDFDADEVMPGLRLFAEQAKVPADELRQEVLKRLRASGMKRNDLKRVERALDPTAQPAKSKPAQEQAGSPAEGPGDTRAKPAPTTTVAAAPAPQAPPQGRAPEAAAPAPKPQNLPPAEEADARPELGSRWDAMTPDERQAVAAKAGWATARGGANPQGRAISKKPWAAQVAGTRKRLGDAMPAPAAPKPAPAPTPAPEPAPLPAAEPAPVPEPPARTPEQARTIELKKRLKVLEALRRCVG